MFLNKKNEQPSKLSHAEERMQNFSELMQILGGVENGDVTYIEADDFGKISIDEILKYNGILHIGNICGENPLLDVEFYSIEPLTDLKLSIHKIIDKKIYNELYLMYKAENDYRYDFENNCIRPEYLKAQQQQKDNFIPNNCYHIDNDKKAILVMGNYIKHCMSGGNEAIFYWLNGFCHFLLQTVIDNEWEVEVENKDTFQDDFTNYVLAVCSKLIEDNHNAVVFSFKGEMTAGFAD